VPGTAVANTFTATPQTISGGASGASLVINGNSGTNRLVEYDTAATVRFQAGMNSSQDYIINRFDASGVFVDAPFSINQSTGVVTVGSVAISTAAATRTSLAVPGTGVTNTFTARQTFANAAGSENSIRASAISTSYPIAAYNTGGNNTTLIGFYDSTGVSTIGAIKNVSDTDVDYQTFSDGRLKTVVGHIDSGSIIDGLNPIRYYWNTDPSKEVYCGLIAQEVNEILPTSVSTGEGEVGEPTFKGWHMAYGKELVAVLLAEVKALRGRVAELEVH